MGGGGLAVPLILLTDRRQAVLPLVDVVRAAVEAGVRLVVLREKDLLPLARQALATRLHAVLSPAGGRLLLAGPEPGPDGRHLAAADTWPADRPAVRNGLLGRSCHSHREFGEAAEHCADYATLSPIFPTASKPGYGPPLGPAAFARPAPLPVYALGGVDTPRRAGRCVEAGAAGVAVMGAVMRASDPAAVIRGLLTAAGS